MRDIEDAGGASHLIVFFYLRAIVDGHIPACEIDHFGPRI
jgi:hypothetical protein